MDTLFSIIKYLIYVAFLGSAVYARGLYLELKSTKEKLEKSEKAVKFLEKELQEAYKQIEKQ